jgi:glycosyltransferase involved in cell wall biosynthesis
LAAPPPVVSPVTPRRICFVAHSSYGEMAGGRSGEVGGIQRQQSLMARWLASRGHDVSMLTWDEGQEDGVVLDGVRMLKMCRHEAGVRGLRFFYPRWTSLRSGLRRADADVYYHNTSETVTGQVAQWCRHARRTFVFSVANDWDCDPRVLSGRSLRERVLYLYGLRHASRIISQTTKQQRILRDAFGLDSTVIPMPCPPVAGSNQRRTERPRGSPPRVLWVGRFVQAKRLEVLLDIAEQARDLMFDVAGTHDGEDQYSLQVLARAQQVPNVRLLGRVPREDMPALYRAAACLCCTSGHEGFPNTFLEAWCQGVPLVSCFDPDHIVERRGLGFVAHDAVSLTAAIRRLLDSEEEWLTISERCRQYYFESHLPEAVMPLFERVFVDFARNGRAR